MSLSAAESRLFRRGRSPSLVARLLRHAHEAPDRPAMRLQGLETSWADHRDAVLRTAHDLRDRGVGTGDGVALLLKNRPEFLTVTHAAAAISAITVPVNFRLTADEVSFILRHPSPRVLVTEPQTRTLADDAVAHRSHDQPGCLHRGPGRWPDPSRLHRCLAQQGDRRVRSSRT